MNFSDPTAIMFGLYLLAMLCIGFLGYRGTDSAVTKLPRLRPPRM